MNEEPFPSRAITRATFLYIAVAAAIIALIYGLNGDWWVVFISILGGLCQIVTTVADSRGWPYARYFGVLNIAVFVGGLMPEPFVSHEFSIAIFLIPVLASIFLGPTGIIASLALTYGLLIMRSGGQTIYLHPTALLLTTMVMGGMALSRYLADQARAQARMAAAAAERHEAAARMQAQLLDIIDQAVLASNFAGRITYLNAAAERLYAWPASEALGQSAEMLIAEPSRELSAQIGARLAAGQSWSGEFVVQRRDGRQVPVLSVISPIRDSSGVTVGIIGVAQDISERKQAEEALRVSEERYRLITESIRDFICLLDSEGRYVYASPSYELLGYNHLELIGKPAFAPVHPDDAMAAQLAWERLQSGEVANVTFRFADAAGDWHWFEAQGTPFFWQNQHVGLIAGHDVTARVQADTARERLQSQLQQAQRLESIGRLAGGIAHDINNLLTVIIGHADLGHQLLPASSPAAADFEAIFSVSQRAAQLTRSILAFARRQILAPQPTNLNSLIIEMDRLLRRLIGEHIELVTLLSDEIGLVNVDPTQIEQVLINLAVNGRDAMPSGGKLIIQTLTVTVTNADAPQPQSLAAGQYVQIMVSDTGVGMAPELLGQIFEPFFTTKAPGKGTGLGLATVYGIIRQHDGSIEVQSQPGFGTTFMIYLPQVEGSVAPTVALPVSELTCGNETILVVEDEPAVRAVTGRTLRTYGYTVVEAANGDEALRVLATHQPPIKLIVSDLVMPLMGGLELARRVAVHWPQLPVMFVSGYSDETALPPDVTILHKPFAPATLAMAVRARLDSRS